VRVQVLVGVVCGALCRRYLAGKTPEKKKKSESGPRRAALGKRGEKLHRKSDTDRREANNMGCNCSTMGHLPSDFDTHRSIPQQTRRGRLMKGRADFPFPIFSLILNLLSLRLLFPRFISSLSTAIEEIK
jgi:hypothetical protein